MTARSSGGPAAWLALLVIGLASVVVEAACPDETMRETAESIALALVFSNKTVEDVGTTFGEINGGQEALHLAVAVLTDGARNGGIWVSDTSRSRALQVARYAFASHAVAISRENPRDIEVRRGLALSC